MAITYKSVGKRSLFDEEFSIEKLSSIGNSLETISKVIDFEMFRCTLESNLLNTTKKSNAGAKPYDVMHAGRRKTKKFFMAIKIMQKLIQKANS